MKNTKRLAALLIALVMVFAVGATMLIACDPDTPDPDPTPSLTGGSYDIKVWVSEVTGVADQFQAQIERFNETNEYGFIFNATIEGVTEGDSATNMIEDVANGADLFAFAQDQTARLVQAGALAQPGIAATEEIKSNNDAGAVKAATVGGNVVAYPLTSDNGYFMYYNKTVISEDHIGDLAAIVADCEAAGMNFSMQLEGSAWYMASFFFATGCVSNWTTDADGKFTSVDDTFNSDAGIAAMKGMQILTKSTAYVNSQSASDLGAATPSAVVVSGTWDGNTARDILGDDLGVAELPSFTVDGQTYHLGSFSGNKLLGVKPTSDANKAAGLSLLARYLTNEECQLERFNSFGWGPSNVAAQANEAVQNDATLTALAKQNEYATPQGQIHGSWWDYAPTLASVSRTATTEAELKEALESYEASTAALFAKSEEELRAWSVIGVIGDTNWDADLKMIEDPENTWISEKAYAFTAETEFKLRQGGSWTVNLGLNGVLDGANITLEGLGLEAGTYYIKVVLTVGANGSITGGDISLIPA